MSRSTRSLYWASIIYFDSGNIDNILDFFNNRGICFYLSPSHEYDKDDEGNYKKTHRHLLLKFHSLKSQAQVQAIISPFTNVLCVVVSNLKQYARYLIHADNPEKYQYDFNDVITNGDYSYFFNDEFAISSLTKLVNNIRKGVSISNLLTDALHSNDMSLVSTIQKNVHLLRLIKQEYYEDINNHIT